MAYLIIDALFMILQTVLIVLFSIAAAGLWSGEDGIYAFAEMAAAMAIAIAINLRKSS